MVKIDYEGALEQGSAAIWQNYVVTEKWAEKADAR
jgi:hypothetical protein